MVRAISAGDVYTSIKILEDAVMEGRGISQFVSDLTWYLRNLLLAKTSDDMSIIADMSREALERLVDEARLVPTESIIRYIRVFSELTNQIRYASNKRVLTEIAVVKLCKPETEATADSVIPRIASIEDKLENGVIMSGVGAGAAQAGAASGDVADGKPKPKPAALPKSVPDDIKAVVENWRKILGAVDISHRMFAKNAKPSLGAEGELLLVFSKEACRAHFECAEDTTKAHAEQNLQDLKSTIEQIVGKEISIKTVLAEDEVHYETDYPDLTKMFGMTVVEED
jgi:DNA polymerase-3 subunit gamma/tau